MTAVLTVRTMAELAILDLRALLRVRTDMMMSPTQLLPELDHVIKRSGLDLWEFPRPFRDLHRDVKERSELPGGFGFYVPGIYRTLGDTMKGFVEARGHEAEALTDEH